MTQPVCPNGVIYELARKTEDDPLTIAACNCHGLIHQDEYPERKLTAQEVALRVNPNYVQQGLHAFP